MAGAATKTIRPMLSTNLEEAHRRVLGLYRAAYRYIPYLLKYHDIPKNECDARCKLRELFYKHAHIQDFRVIDVLVIKGCMELAEIRHQWQQKHHLMDYWKPSIEPKPTTFIGKFLHEKD